MTISHKVVWSEGMFINPQHFQQQDRYFERLLEDRCSAYGPYFWGFKEFAIDTELLKLGKISLARARGVFPDGTPVDIPNTDPLPPVLEVPDNCSNTTVCLCMPLRRSGAQEIAIGEASDSSTRFSSNNSQVRNNCSENADEVEIQTARPSITLKLASEDLNGYACLAVVKILEKTADKPVQLEGNFIPPVVNCEASQPLKTLLKELQGLIHQRGEALGGRLSDSGRAGSAEIADYMLLQVINRIEPLCNHFAQVHGLHPLEFYTELIQMAGELTTFTTTNKRPPSFPPYRHDDLITTFSGIFSILRQCLSTVLESSAVSLDLTERKFGIYVAPITDQSMISSSMFILAVKADLEAEQVRKHFSTQTKVASVEHIREYISAQMPGIGLTPLPVAPRQIPYHAGFNYFELSRGGEVWEKMTNSGGFAVHVGADLPGLTMELWAIRS